MKNTIALIVLVLLMIPSLSAQTNRIKLLDGERSVYRPRSADDRGLTQISERGEADLDGVEFEVEFKVQIRGTRESLLGALFEKGSIGGLRGQCDIYVDGEPMGKIVMSSGRMEYAILNGILDNALSQAKTGTPDPPDVDFSKDSDKAEWSRVITYDGMNYKIMIRFVYRQSSNEMHYYVFVEKG